MNILKTYALRVIGSKLDDPEKRYYVQAESKDHVKRTKVYKKIRNSLYSDFVDATEQSFILIEETTND